MVRAEPPIHISFIDESKEKTRQMNINHSSCVRFLLGRTNRPGGVGEQRFPPQFLFQEDFRALPTSQFTPSSSMLSVRKRRTGYKLPLMKSSA
jgi:hypothetical protein